MKPAQFGSGARPLLIAALLLCLPVAAQNLSSVSLSPTSIVGGVTPAPTGTVTLSANAPTGGKVVNLSSSNTAAATVPSSVTVASGTKTKTFVVTTTPQPTDANAVISAVLSGVTKTANLAVKAPVMSAASVAPASVTGGTGATLTVTLTGNAPAAGKAVTLSSGTPLAATVPASVTVQGGAKTATAAVTTLGVDANATVTLTATAGGVAKTASLTVSKPALTTLAISPSTIPGGGTATGTLTLTGPAGPSGATVALASSNTNVATVPPSKAIASGQATGTFLVTGTSLPAGGTATITATWSGVSKTMNVTLQPSASLQAVGLTASSIRGGQPVAGTVTLSASAPSGGVVVNLTSSNTAAATIPSSVTVPQGLTTAGFTVTTLAVDSVAPLTITGTSSGVSKTAPLTVEPAVLTGLTISPQSIPGGTTATGTLALDGPAGPAGATISLTSNDTNVATVPTSKMIAAGQATGTFTITGAAVTGDTATTISATLASETHAADLTVTRTIGTLTGTVRDASTGFTLPSAHVVLSADPARETWTDGNGQFQLIDVPAGLHTVEVSYERYSSATSSAVTVTNGQTATVPPVSISPILGAITGTIRDQNNGDQPVEGAVVTEATGLHTATTDANGRFELAGLAPGFTYLVVHRNGFRPGASSELWVDADWTHDVSVGVLPTWEGDLPGEIEGVVRDSAGNPASGATVSVVGNSGLSATTGSDGRYSLTVPAALGWIIQAEKAGYLRTVSRYLRASMGDRPYHIAHDFTLPPSNATGTLELRTFDPVSRNPFRADFWFRTPTGIWHAPVPDSGTRTVPGVPAGLVWDCFGHRILPAGGTLTLRCPGEPVVPPGSPRWAASGVVGNVYSSEPIAGANATFVNGSTVVSATSDANGLFSTHSGPEGEYSVTVASEAFLQTEPWVFTAADNQEYGSFYGAWLWPEMPGGSVSITAPAEGALLTSSSIQVEVAFAPARPGDQLLWAWAWPSAGNVTSVTPAYSADGMSAVITIEGAFPNGALTVGVEVVTQTGAGLSAQRNLTVNLPTHPTGLNVSPSTVPGGSVATGTVTVDPPAPAGGAFVTLSSSSPAVTVPTSVSFVEGQTARTFEIVAAAVASQTVATISASVGPFTASATLTVNPTSPPPVVSDLAEGDLSGWQGFADPPYSATVSLDTTRVKVGSASMRFVTDSGFDCGVRYIVPGGAHWDLRGVRFLTFWSFGDNTEAFQGEQPVVILRGPGGSIRFQPPNVQSVIGGWMFHRVPLGSTSDWIVTTEGEPSLGDITSFEIHQDVWGMGMTVFYDGVAFASEVPEDLAEGTAAFWGTFASDNAATSVVDDASDVRTGASALRFDTASGFDTGLVFPKAGAGQTHWDLSDVRSVTAWIRAEHVESFQGNYPVLVLRSPSGLVRYEPGDVLLNTPGWRFYEIPLDGIFPWTRTQEGTPDLTDVTAIEIHGDIWGAGFRLYVDGVSVGRPLPLVTLSSESAPEGSTVTATVFLSDVAPAGGRTVLVSTSDPAIASVPASVVVLAGQRSTTFAVTAGSLTVGTPVTITVTDRGFSVRTSLRVEPIVDVTSVTLGAPSVLGGTPVAGTVTIEAPAGAGGVAVLLASSNPGVASVPSALLIPEGAVVAPFTVTTVAVASSTPVSISANAGGVSATATLTVTPPVVPTLPPLATDLAEGDLSGWQGFAGPPYVATVSLETTRTRVGSSSLKFVTDSGFDSGVRYTVPGGAHWDLSGIRFLTFWSFGDNTGAFQGEQPVVVLRGPGGSIRLQPPAVQTFNGGWRFHRVPLGDASDWVVTTEGTPSLGDISSFEIHQDIEGMGMTVFYDGVALTSDIPEDLAEGTAALWGTFASDNQASFVVDDGSDLRSGTSALRFDTASGFDTGLVFPKAGAGQTHWDLSDVRSVAVWIRPENAQGFQGNQPVLVLRSPSGSVRYEPGDVLVNTPGWRFYEIPLDGTFPWTRTQTGTPDVSDVTAIELHGDTWGAGFRLYVDGVSVGRPLPLVKLPSASAPGGSTVTASVFLSEAAPVGGRHVVVSSSDSGLASVPPSVLVPEGARSATFPVTTSPVTTGTPVSITVTDRGYSAHMDLRVDPVVDVSSLTLGSPSTIGGLSVAGTVTIGAPAWPGGTAVTLSSSNPGVASVPAVVTIPAGGSTASFSVTTGAVAADTTVAISANAGAATAAASLTVVPAPPPELSAMTITPSRVLSGANPRLTVSLTAPAPIGGAVVALTASPTGLVSIPSAVVAAAGTATAEATVNVPVLTAPVAIVLTATVGSSARTAELNVSPPAGLLSVSAAPGVVTAGGSTSVAVSLVSAAPSGGKTILLASSVPDALVVPATILIPEGASTVSVAATAPASAPDAAVTITALDGSVQETATVAVLPSARVAALSFAASGGFPGEAVTGTLTLTAAAPVGGYSINVTSSRPDVISVPASIIVPAGELSTTFQATVAATGPGGFATVSASKHGVTKVATVAGVSFAGFLVTPTVAVPRAPVHLMVNLTASVPAGRVVDLTLASSNPTVAPVSATAQIPANASSLYLPVTWTDVAADTQVEFTVTALGVTRTVTVVLETLKIICLAPRSGHTTVPACSSELMRITTNAAAPTGGATFQLQVENGLPSGASSVLGTSPVVYGFVLPEGRSTLDVSTMASWTLESRQLVTMARLGPSQVVHTMAIEAGTVSISAIPATAPRGSTVRVKLGTPGGSSCYYTPAFDAPASSNNAAVLPIPATVHFNWSSNPEYWYVDLPVPATASSGVARLTFSALGTTVFVDVTVPESSMAGFSLNPTEAPAGAQVTGLVKLDMPAPSGGAQVLLQSSDPAKASVPASVEIPAGMSSVSFTLTPQETAAAADAVVTATVGSETLTAAFRTLPSNAATIVGRIVDSTDYDVEAPVSGATATHLPGPGQYLTGTDGAFRLHAEPGSATVQLAAPGFLPFTTEPLPISASQTLDLGTHRARRPGGGPRGTSGTVVDPQGNPIYGAEGVLEGYDVSVRTDGAGRFHLNIPEARRRYRMTFSKAGYETWTEDFVSDIFIGSCPGASSDCFVLDPYPRATLDHAAFEKPSALSESRAQLQIFVVGRIPEYGAAISLTRATVRSPGSDTFERRVLFGPLQSGQFATWDVDLPKVTEPTTVEYVVFYGGQRKTASIEVVPQTLEIRCSGVPTPTTTVSCSVTLRTGTAPASGAVVSLTSTAPDLFTVPTSVTVPPGQWSVDFPLTVTGLVFSDPSHSRKGTFRASWAGGWDEATVVVSRPDVASVTVSPAAIVGGGQATGTVGLMGPAYPTGQTIVTLESTLSNITVPPTVTIASGASTATFPIETTAVTQPTTGTIRARLTTLADLQIANPVQRTADLLLTPSSLGLACAQTEPIGGHQVSCQVSLPGSPAPAGGVVVSLSSSSGVVSVPASVTVPEGQFARTFSVTTTPTVSTTTGVVRATLGAEVAEVSLTVRQPTLSALGSVYGTTITGGLRSQANVSLDGYAPAGGIVVQLSSASAAVSLPASVLVPEGSTSGSFELTTASVAALTEVALSASSGSVTVTKTFTLKPQTWQLTPLAPGRALAGSGEVTLYGSHFLPSDRIQLSGPVYSVAAPDVALCDEPAGACPAVDASESTAPGQFGFGGGSRIVFTVPLTLNPGYYTVRVRSAAGTLSSAARWLLLADPSPVVPALAPEQHGLARPITSGQTVTGTFLENGDASGTTNDFNLYYFVAAAGTRVSVRLERADASLPWEHPDSLDPQIALIAPDGFVYENEGRRDVTPATDLNADVTNLLLPQTGMWLIAASTTRGHGDYRLSYTMTPPGSVPSDQQIVAFAGRGTTAQVGADVRLTLAAMDPRGYLLSGAGVSFSATYPDAGAGTVEWPTGRSTFTAVDGLAQQRVRTTTRGAVDFAVNFNSTSPANAVFPPDPEPALMALVDSVLATLPQYQPLEHHPYSVRDVDPDGNLTLDLGPVRTLKPSRPSRLRPEWKSGPGGARTLNASPAPMPELQLDPTPRPLPQAGFLVAPTCTAPTHFRHVAVDVPEPKTPYTVTLEDLTPRIGETLPPGPVGPKGIEGHRIEKKIRLQVDVKDRDGNPPPHPVLLRLSVGGPRSGRLIVGPAGAQVLCKEAYVVWHEADSQGNPGTEPVTFDYELGTLSLLPGVEPDPEHPGQVKPVWGVTEVLDISTEVITSEATLLSVTTFAVLPQPGRPKSLVDWDGPPEDDRWEWWNGYHTYYDSTKRARAVSLTNYNAYTLVDKYGNTVWGCRDTTTQHGGSRLTVDLPYQELTGPDFRAYALKLQWWADGSGQMPQGATSVALRVSYPESPGDWLAGEVATSTLIDLQGGTQTHLKRIGRYEARFGMDDGTFPISVSPTAGGNAIPTVEQGPAPAPTRSLESHRRMALVLLTGTEAPSMQEVFRAPHHPWRWTGGGWVEQPLEPAPDPRIDVAVKPRLKLKLIDVNGYVQAAAGFKVHLCPRFDHEGSPAAPEWACPTAPVESSNGIIESISMNPGIVGSGDPPSPDATGYLGLELTTAPTAPGTYYVYVESLDKDVKIRDQSDLHMDDTPEGQYQGGFALCTVEGGEFLDENFQRINLAELTEPREVYVRYVDTNAVGTTALIDVISYRDTAVPFDGAFDLPVSRLGASSAFLSSPAEIRPVWASGAASNVRQLAGPGGPIIYIPPKIAKMDARKRNKNAIAQAAVRSGPAYVLPSGRRMALGLYQIQISHPEFPAFNGTYSFACAPDAANDFCGGDRVPADLISWQVGAGAESYVRIERERFGTNLGDFPEAWYARALRITSNRMPPVTVVTAEGSYLSDDHAEITATVSDGRLCLLNKVLVEVRRPVRLGSRQDKYPVEFLGDTVLIEDEVISRADDVGLPPQYLMAQAFGESGGNTHGYRYEPSSRDFKYLVGDTDGNAFANRTRKVTNATMAFLPESVSPDGSSIQVLPCDRDSTYGLWLTDPCDAGPPREIESGALTRIDDLTWKLPGTGKVQLDVKVSDASGRTLAFDVPCVPASLGSTSYCADGDTRTVHFGSAPTPPVTAEYHPVKFHALPGGLRLGVALSKGPTAGSTGTPAGSVELIQRWATHGPGSNLPTSLFDTIRGWAQRGGGRLADSQILNRYGKQWRGDDILEVLRNDPSFEVQAQWFGAGSFGLLQVIPDDLRVRVMEGVPQAEWPQVFGIFDPAGSRDSGNAEPDSPLRLWDPVVGIRMGARMDVLAEVKDELAANPYSWEESCTIENGLPNDCTWRRLWKRRLRVFNSGREDDSRIAPYADNIIDVLAPRYLGQ